MDTLIDRAVLADLFADLFADNDDAEQPTTAEKLQLQQEQQQSPELLPPTTAEKLQLQQEQ